MNSSDRRFTVPTAALALALTLTAGTLPAAGAGAAGIEARSPAARATLIELFTSEGCSSCPPAEAWMNRLRSDPRLWSELVPVAFHVDYWDYIGWSDRFAAPEHARRQRDYASAGQLASVYTPGLVANGEEWRGWFRSPVLHTGNGAEVGPLSIRVRDGALEAHFEPTAAQPQLVLNVALLGFGLRTRVEAGENSGRDLEHEFVVLGLRQLPMLRRGSAHAASGPLPGPRVPAERYGVAAWVSRTASQVPIQATGAMLAR